MVAGSEPDEPREDPMAPLSARQNGPRGTAQSTWLWVVVVPKCTPVCLWSSETCAWMTGYTCVLYLGVVVSHTLILGGSRACYHCTPPYCCTGHAPGMPRAIARRPPDDCRSQGAHGRDQTQLTTTRTDHNVMRYSPESSQKQDVGGTGAYSNAIRTG